MAETKSRKASKPAKRAAPRSPFSDLPGYKFPIHVPYGQWDAIFYKAATGRPTYSSYSDMLAQRRRKRKAKGGSRKS